MQDPDLTVLIKFRRAHDAGVKRRDPLLDGRSIETGRLKAHRNVIAVKEVNKAEFGVAYPTKPPLCDYVSRLYMKACNDYRTAIWTRIPE